MRALALPIEFMSNRRRSIPMRSARIFTEERGRSSKSTAFRSPRGQAHLAKRSDYDRFDYIVGMDRYNMRDMLRLFKNDPQEKCSLLLDWPGWSRDVADPWYTGDFETTFEDVDAGCTVLLEEIKRR